MKNLNPANMLKLVTRGLAYGQKLNTTIRDLATGSFLFRHSSRVDAAARQMEKARNQDRAAKNRELQAHDRFDQALEHLEQHIHQREKIALLRTELESSIILQHQTGPCGQLSAPRAKIAKSIFVPAELTHTRAA